MGFKGSNRRVLVVYFHRLQYPMRETQRQHIFCFQDYLPHDCVFLNAAFGVPSYIKKMDFDLVVIEQGLLMEMRCFNQYDKWMECLSNLRDVTGTKVIVPQDEHWLPPLLNQFVRDFGVSHIFTVSPESEWHKFYNSIDRAKTTLQRVLNGYVDRGLVNKIDQLSKLNGPRDLDISYRTWRVAYWLGSHGILKADIADQIQKVGGRRGLKLDISTDARRTIYGLDWYRFLLRSKYTLGVEGGCSILHSDGSIRHSVEQYLKNHPQASFETVRQACLVDVDGEINYTALTPRQLEACLTRTCQILIEGDYNGILKPWEHYIPLKRDFSNIEEVMDIVQKDQLRKDMVERAYSDVILSGKYSYQVFVETLLKVAAPPRSVGTKAAKRWRYWHLCRNALLWGWIIVEGTTWQFLRKRLPIKAIDWLRQWLRPWFVRRS